MPTMTQQAYSLLQQDLNSIFKSPEINKHLSINKTKVDLLNFD